jgi:two-component system chemotaxis response regulator CheB
MILFCEECGTRNDIDQNEIEGDHYSFACQVCHEKLVVSLVDKTKGKTVQAAMQQGITTPKEIEVEPLKVLVVDDSKMIRRVLCDIINSDKQKEVVGEAANGKEALELLRSLNPDVITLDINMPVMDGLTTLKHVMITNPTPTVMISALTQEGASETFDALKYGAIDFLPKPSQVKGGDLQSQQAEILRKIDLVAEVQIESIRYLRRPTRDKEGKQKTPDREDCQCYLALGASEGGYGALLNVIPRLKLDLPAAYVAVMHQAPHHLDAFARYLDQCSHVSVERALDGSILKSGVCYLAASTEYATLANDSDQMVLQVNASPFPTRYGAINRLMSSASQAMPEKVAGVILTGTGKDGLEGLGDIIAGGGTAFIQDPRSCLFKETPMEAAKMYDVEYLVSDKQMAGAINAYITSLTR